MGRHSDALLARAVNVTLAPEYSQKSRAVSEGQSLVHTATRPPGEFPPYLAAYVSGAAPCG
jgi:hypothetical protein